MRWGIMFILLSLFAAKANAMPDPKNEPWNQRQTEFVRPLDGDIEKFWPLAGFVNVLKKELIIQGSGTPTLADVQRIQKECGDKPFATMTTFPTPKEFERSKIGDCKGYAIYRYYKLRAAGFTDDQINFWSGKYNGIDHMVLVVKVDGKEIVMDIMEPNLPEAKDYMFKKFSPVYRFNSSGWSYLG